MKQFLFEHPLTSEDNEFMGNYIVKGRMKGKVPVITDVEWYHPDTPMIRAWIPLKPIHGMGYLKQLQQAALNHVNGVNVLDTTTDISNEHYAQLQGKNGLS